MVLLNMQKYCNAWRAFYRNFIFMLIMTVLLPILIAVSVMGVEILCNVWIVVICSLYIVFILFLLIITGFVYPELTEECLVIRHKFFRFYRKNILYSEIETIEFLTKSSIIHRCVMRVKSKNKSRYSSFCFDDMSLNVLPEFVEELRSKGVEVKCPPYKYKGRMIYL